MSSLSMRVLGAMLLIVGVAACAHTAMPLAATPSQLEFHSAMERAFFAEIDGRLVTSARCRAVRQLQCLPLDYGREARCVYRYGRAQTGTAVLELGRHGSWAWLSGPRDCSATRMN